MQLPLTWTVGTDHHRKLFHPCRIDQRSNEDELYEQRRDRRQEENSIRNKRNVSNMKNETQKGSIDLVND